MNKLRALFAAATALPLVAQAASLTYLSAATNSSTAASATYTSNAFTPTANRTLIAGCLVSGTLTNPATMSNSTGMTFTQVAITTRSTSDNLYVFVGNTKSDATSQTLTCDVTGDNGTGGLVFVYESDVPDVGSDAVRDVSAVLQVGTQLNVAGPSTAAPALPQVALTTNPTLWCEIVGSNPPAITAPTNWTEDLDTGFDTPSTGVECAIRNSGFTGTTVTGGTSKSAYGSLVMEFDAGSGAATFTAGPAAGTITPVAIPVTFTSDTNGTVKGTACADGTAGNATETLAGQCTGGVAASATISIAVTATVGTGGTFSSLTPSSRYDLTFVIDAVTDSAATPLANQDTIAVAFSAGPTITPISEGFRFGGTPNATATFYGVCYSPIMNAPSAAQIAAGTNINGVAAILSGNESWAGADTLDITAANKPVRYSCSVVLKIGTAYSAVTSFTNQNRLARANKSIVVIASVGTGGVCALTDHFTEDCAVGDVFEYDSAMASHSNCYITFATTGVFTYFDHTDGSTNDGADTDAGNDAVDDCVGRMSFTMDYQNVSDEGTMCFTAPTVGCFGTADTHWVNNTPPTFVSLDSDIVLERNDSVTGLGLDMAALHWQDDDGDAIVISYPNGLPAGLGVSTNALTGAPTTCGISDHVERATDTTEEYTDHDVTFGVGETIPDVSGMDATAATAVLEALCQ